MAGLGLNVGADLAATFGTKLDALQASADRQEARDYSVSMPLTGSITAPGSENDGTIIAGPEGGKEWHVRRVSLSPAQVGGSITAGTIVIGKATGLTISAQGSGKLLASAASQFVEVARSPQAGGTGGAPCFFTFSHSQFVLRYPQNLAVLWLQGSGTLMIDGEALELLANISYGDT